MEVNPTTPIPRVFEALANCINELCDTKRLLCLLDVSFVLRGISWLNECDILPRSVKLKTKQKY